MSDTPESLSTPASAKRLPRSWPQRFVIAAVFLLGIGSFGAAGALYAGQRIIEDRNLTAAIIDPSRNTSFDRAPLVTSDVTEASEAGEASSSSAPSSAPPETFPPAEPDARNFLITGADNNSCVDPDSPFARTFGDRSNFGERSDTIMTWRMNPRTSQVAVLSYPRDLFVDIAGTSRRGRINEAYQRDNPQRLIDTIYQNFGINTDHFVQVDFCAFRTLVNAVGGVAVPFDTPVRDRTSGLDVTEAGCFTFDGDHALAYVRSRKLLSLDENGDWKQDGTSDLGRISRQQDFLRRTVSRLLSKGAFNPDVARGLIETVSEHIVSDPDLTVRRMLEFAGVMRGVDPGLITSYQITADPTQIQGNSVLVPRLQSNNMQAILAVFRGDATLAGIPEQVLTTGTDPTTDQPGASSPDSPTDDSARTTPGTTLPTVDVEQKPFGIVPDINITC